MWFKSTLFLFILACSFQLSAVEFSFGPLAGKTGSEQDQVNTLIANANTEAGSISTGDLNSAWEMGAFFQWKFDYFAVQFRGSYFTQSEDGTSSAGDNYNYGVSGQTLGAVFKLYPLENNIMRVFFQTGAIWGSAELDIEEKDLKVTADGSEIGYVIGAGAEMTFDAHVIFAEVNFRYLDIERTQVSSSSGTPINGSFSQYGDNDELELANKDLGINLSGTVMSIGYAYRF